MLRTLSSAAALAFLGLLAGGCQQKSESAWPDKPGPKVLTSFAPVQCFVLNVVGEDGAVVSLLSTKGPHDHGDPTAQHLKLGTQADVLFINGLGIDDKIGRVLKQKSGKGNFNLVELGEKLDKKCLLEGACHHEHGHAAGEEHDHGTDPHVWLSPKNARAMVEAVRDEMKRLDPAHAEAYDRRAAAYLNRLEQLESYGVALLKDKKERKLVAFHDSLRYFAQCYGLTIADSIQVEPGIEPSEKHMKKIIEMCKKDGVRHIAVEPQFPSRTSAATILSELKKAGIEAEFVEIDPLETADPERMTPEMYERTMRANLDNLAKALR